MRALVVETLSEDFAGCAIREVPTPQSGPGEVLVRVRAASVNFPDLLMTRGEYQFKPPLPFIPGLDLAGEVAALGERVKEITGGRGADVIYDPVGGDVFDESVRCIAFDGRLLVIGFTSGRIPNISVNMPLIKGFSVMGVRAGEYGRQFPEKGRENAQ